MFNAALGQFVEISTSCDRPALLPETTCPDLNIDMGIRP